MNAIAIRPDRPLLAELDARQPQLARFGWAMLALTVACVIGMALDPRTLNGVSVWVKPAKFAASFVAWSWTLAWAWGVLAPAAREGIAARAVLWGTLGAAGFEQGWITLRAALGVLSHFAGDALGGVMYSLMGAGAVTLVALAALLGLLVLLRGDPAQPRPWRLAVGLGLVIGGVLGGVSGASISGLGTPKVGGTASDAANLAPFFWSRDGGDLRVAHFLSIHAMQALPLLALLGAGAGMVWAGALGWTALSVAAYLLALGGVPLSP
ncbi:hypothetical protein [Falsiroseomonas oryziterrae]|uniref:hypothetical protein n=1 Tax=Falsiroseomonas oryziterrae TaxID=2911368 RepID=UPI001F41F5BA|nr:hypothetical protein [Roseomonas sp. NPKOSM-4]